MPRGSGCIAVGGRKGIGVDRRNRGEACTSEYVEHLIAHVSGIQLGVADLDRAEQVYGEKLGWRIEIDRPFFVSFAAEDGSSAVGLYPRAFLGDDAGSLRRATASAG